MHSGYRYGTRHLAVAVQRLTSGSFAVTVDGRRHEVEASVIDPSRLRLVVDGHPHAIHLTRIGGAEHVACNGSVYVLTPEVSGGVRDHAASLALPQIVAPMPGKVLHVLVQPGQQVEAGDGLLILEAMKMEHRMVAEAAGTVQVVHVADGQMVDAGAVLVELQY
jgi:biotin carboxyl carrier protein